MKLATSNGTELQQSSMGDAIKRGDHEKANEAHDRVIGALMDLRETAGESRGLLGLLEDANPSVRCWAATHLLPLEERIAVAVLKEVSAGDGFIAFAAETVLEEWKKGTLVLP